VLDRAVAVHNVPRRTVAAAEPHGRQGRTTITGGDDPGNATAGGASERELVAAVVSGRRDAFRPLVERNGPALVRACYRILGDLAEAEDVAQEAFVIAYRALDTWRGDGAFGAWLARIGVRLAIRRARTRRSVVRIDVAQAAGGTSGGGDPRAVIASSGLMDRNDPASIVTRNERAVELRRAVARLDEPYAEVVALRFFGERSLLEIAEATGRPLATVKTHLRRGLLRLRDEMAGAESR